MEFFTPAIRVHRPSAFVALLFSSFASVAFSAESGVPWRYARTDEFEILSSCNDDKANAYLRGVYRALPLADLPVALRVGPTPPIRLILDDGFLDDDLAPRGAPDSLRNLRNGTSGIVYATAWHERELVMRVGLRGWDYLASDIIIASLPLRLLPFMVEQRLPDAPPWLAAGLHGIYCYDDAGADLDGPTIGWWQPGELIAPVADSRRRPERLIALPDFFNHVPPTEAAYERWRAQAILFAHWGLFTSPQNRSGFWAFSLRAMEGPITEAGFQGSFGLSFAEGRRALADDIPKTMAGVIVMRPVATPSRAPIVFRPASRGEIGRLQGEWLRLKSHEFTASQPALAATFLGRCGTVLRQNTDDSDAGWMAASAAFHLESGQADAALSALERAFSRNLSDTQALSALGALRLRKALAQPEGEKGRLSSAQTAAILQPLYRARALPPANRNANEFLLDVWLASEISPTAAQLRDLRVGLGPFPRQSGLALKLAQLATHAGFVSEAAEIARSALRLASDPALRRQLEELASRAGTQ